MYYLSFHLANRGLEYFALCRFQLEHNPGFLQHPENHSEFFLGKPSPVYRLPSLLQRDHRISSQASRRLSQSGSQVANGGSGSKPPRSRDCRWNLASPPVWLLITVTMTLSL